MFQLEQFIIVMNLEQTVYVNIGVEQDLDVQVCVEGMCHIDWALKNRPYLPMKCLPVDTILYMKWYFQAYLQRHLNLLRRV